MKILAIETSCDDTGVAILEANNKGDFKVLSNIIASQIEIHRKYGGVYPMMAKREHQKNLVLTIKKALKKADLLEKTNTILPKKQLEILEKILKREDGLLQSTMSFLKNHKKPSIDFISVTHGPGLEPCLWVGVNFAKALSFFWNIKIVPTNHIESHILVNYLQNKKISFPALALVVSGGHTQLILIKSIQRYKIIGETRDDAAGECFDKCAKILGLGYPGGPIISKLATKPVGSLTPHRLSVGCQRPHRLPRPMINTNDYDFSFSGLKTAVLYKWLKISKKKLPGNKRQQILHEICAEIQQSIIDVLLKKTIKAAKDYKVKSIILGGGVSANKELRAQLTEKIQNDNFKIKCLMPEASLSTDNALMTAIAGFFNKDKKVKWQKVKAKANLRID
jgi:N6-L-threonylcarbamoyladenine synthase